jgi:nitrate reductase NapD
MNISGILVVSSLEHTAEVCAQLRNLPGVDIHYVDEDTGRIVITQEAETISAEVDGLKRIRSLAHIQLAEMSSHYFEDDHELINSIPPELDNEALEQHDVPAYLNEQQDEKSST